MQYKIARYFHVGVDMSDLRRTKRNGLVAIGCLIILGVIGDILAFGNIQKGNFICKECASSIYGVNIVEVFVIVLLILYYMRGAMIPGVVFSFLCAANVLSNVVYIYNNEFELTFMVFVCAYTAGLMALAIFILRGSLASRRIRRGVV